MAGDRTGLVNALMGVIGVACEVGDGRVGATIGEAGPLHMSGHSRAPSTSNLFTLDPKLFRHPPQRTYVEH